VTARPSQPLLSPGQAELLLDQVMFEHVAGCVDLDGIYRIEHLLTAQLTELGVAEDQASSTARAVIDRALLRLSGHIREYLNAADWPRLGCALCESEADEEEARGAGGKRGMVRGTHAAIRFDG